MLKHFLLAVFAGWLTVSASAWAQDTTEPQPADIRILSDDDAALYREIFSLQEDGRWTSADQKIAQLGDDTLLGYVQYQRYMHPTAYRSKFSELKRWMAFYADHPEANKVYSLARKRRPRGASSPIRPITRKWRSDPAKELHPDLVADYNRTSRTRLRQIEGRVRHLSNKEQALTALKEIDRHVKRGTITARQYDRMRSWIAASLYYQGYVDKAKKIANSAADRNGQSAVLALWIAGLIDFREGNIQGAYERFSTMADVPYQEDSLRAGAGFWTARTALAAGHTDKVIENLEIAATLPFTFYGQLALAQLGRQNNFDWSTPEITDDTLATLVTVNPRVKRAIALRQAGQETAADTELRWAAGEIEKEMDRSLLAVAQTLDLPAAQLDIALAAEDETLASGLFPIPQFTPQGGFAVDRALLYGLMRQESKFKVEATSRVGARGLMQLMPRTASFIAKDRSLRYAKGRDRLYDPGLNLALGQQYVGHLIDGAANGDLFHLAAAYNGGPGNLRRWKKELDLEDPLLFIESIPNRESRNFVEKVLTNFWIYRARLGQSAPSREKVAAGELPLYEALDMIAQEDNKDL